MEQILGNKTLKELNLPEHIEQLIEKSVSTVRKTIKKPGQIFPPLYLMVDKQRNMHVLPEMGSVPTHEHVSFIKPLIKLLDVEYIVLLAECSVLNDGKARSADDWKEFYKQYGSIDKHPDKIDSVNVLIYSAGRTVVGGALVKTLSAKKQSRTVGEFTYHVNPKEVENVNLNGFFD